MDEELFDALLDGAYDQYEMECDYDAYEDVEDDADEEAEYEAALIAEHEEYEYGMLDRDDSELRHFF